MSATLQFVVPISISLRHHDAALVVVQDCMKAWMKQWSVENNFQPMVTAVGDEERALHLWCGEHVKTARQHFGHLVPEQYKPVYDFSLDFSIEYSVAPFEINKGFWPCGEKKIVSMADYARMTPA